MNELILKYSLLRLEQDSLDINEYNRMIALAETAIAEYHKKKSEE